ncbi:MAG: class I SAM-dependent methyltransferase [Candidatus Omnitrophica bacterium]|nr:class I SAM-dependent methyltransferase [Candidatus Omnitrophota bacterium]MBU1924405.1 class I SAM-dependent methyltransferase [Candidatus Omnitrophota bacterium]
MIKYLMISFVAMPGFFYYSILNAANNYEFTEDWFLSRIPVFEKVLTTYKNKENIQYLEIGVFEGRSLIWMLENVLTHPTTKATAIDIFRNNIVRKRCLKNLKISGVADKVKLIKNASQSALKNLSPHSFDIIYIDGDHDAPSVLTDAILSWPLLKKGGLIIFDDYHFLEGEFQLWTGYAGGPVSPERRPKTAIDGFIDNFRNYIEIVWAGDVYVIRKKEGIYWEYQ